VQTYLDIWPAIYKFRNFNWSKCGSSFSILAFSQRFRLCVTWFMKASKLGYYYICT